MKLNDLKEIIDEMIEGGYGDREVFIAEQPQYPLAAIFQGVYAETEDDAEDAREEPAVWLVAGANTSNRNPYSVPRDAFNDYLG